jgi:hypothetical protein
MKKNITMRFFLYLFKKKIANVLLFLSIFSVASSQNVEVSSNAGSSTFALYPGLYAAFNAINSGIHQGTISIKIVNNFTENTALTAALRPLRASGIGAANYTSVVIFPAGNRVITSAARLTNRGMYEFFGADNVTIDGDDPNTPGLRNLTIQSASSTTDFTAMIRVGSVGTTNTAGANDFSIRNCNIIGPRNSATSTLVSYGVIFTDTSLTVLTEVSGRSSANATIQNNSFVRLSDAIVIRGQVNFEHFAPKIINNVIGSSVDADAVSRTGISLEFINTINSAGITEISGNDIRIGIQAITGITGFSPIGIQMLRSCPNTIIGRNYIHDIKNLTTANIFAAGIFMAGTGTVSNANVVIENNIIKDIVIRRFDPITNGAYGIVVNSPTFTNLKVDYNTIALNEIQTSGTSTAAFSGCFAIIGATNATIASMKNNIFLNRQSSANGFAHLLAITNIPVLTNIDFNSYFTPNCKLGNTAVNGKNHLDVWQQLSGTDLNSVWEVPNFVNPLNDLHIQAGSISKLESAGIPLSAVIDYDVQLRSNTPDIGADEFSGVKTIIPIIQSVSNQMPTNWCSPQSMEITANINSGNALDTVRLVYQFNNSPTVTIGMVNSGFNAFKTTIPIPTPSNAKVTYRVLVTSKSLDTVWSNPRFYNFNIASAAFRPLANPSYDSICSNTLVNFNKTYGVTETAFSPPFPYTTPLLGADITKVVVREGTNFIINNTSTLNSLVGTYGTASGTAGGFADYASLRTDTFEIGKPYTLELTSTSSSPIIKNGFEVYIDLNNDGFFNGINELIYRSSITNLNGGRTEIGQLYINKEVRPGYTKMRIVNLRQIENTFYNDQGEVEDYAIFIKPHEYQWRFNNLATLNFSDTMSRLIPSPPAFVGFYVKDNQNCVDSFNVDTVFPVSPVLRASITSTINPSTCINDEIDLTANVFGGCPPYTYSWARNSNNIGITKVVSDILITANTYTVTVTDRNNVTATATVNTSNPQNPKLTTFNLDSSYLICERGSRTLALKNGIGVNRILDTVLWYNSILKSATSPDGQGLRYLTPVIADTTFFYTRLRRQTTQIVGRTTLGTSAAFLSTQTGLAFNATNNIILDTCRIFADAINGKLVIGVIGKSGNLISRTDTLSINGNSIAAGVKIPLKLDVPKGNEYRLVILFASGFNDFRITTSATVYPMNTNMSMNITSGYNVGNLITQYCYFYSIQILGNICFGTPDSVRVNVIKSKVPQVQKDLERTLLCKGDSLKLSLKTDSLYRKLRIDWYRNNILVKSLDSTRTYVKGNSNNSDTGTYNVIIRSLDSFCVRDTILKKVRVDFHPDAQIIFNPDSLQNFCVNTSGTMSFRSINADTFTWIKNNSVYATGLRDSITFSNFNFADTGFYKLKINNAWRCKEDSSKIFKLSIFNHPQIITDPRDSIYCIGQAFKIKATAKDYTKLQWYKDGVAMNFANKDSLERNRVRKIEQGSYYMAATSYPGCIPAYTNLATITVNENPLTQYINPIRKVCENGNLLVLPNYQNGKRVSWFKGALPILPVSDTLKISNANVTNSGDYFYVVEALDKCTNINSENVKVEVFEKPRMLSTNNDITVCTGDSVVRGFVTSKTKMYQWYRNNTLLQSQVDSQLRLFNITKSDEGSYKVNIMSDPICPDTISSSFQVIATQRNEFSKLPIGLNICAGGAIKLEVDAPNITTYSWFRDNVQIPGQSGKNLLINNVTLVNAGTYTVRISNSAPCPAFTETPPAVVNIRDIKQQIQVKSYSIYNAVEQCTDQDGFTYYADPDNQEDVIIALKKNGNVFTPKLDVVVRPNLFHNNVNTKSEFSGTFLGRRYWNMEVLNGEIINPVEVKHYYDLQEQLQMRSRFNDLVNQYKDIEITTDDIQWFRTESLPFSTSLLSKVQGSNVNFDHRVLGTDELTLGDDNGANYVIVNNIMETNGGSYYMSYKGVPKFITSIKDKNLNQLNANIYPNPSIDGRIKLEIQKKDFEDITMKVYNSIGQVVFETSLIHKNLNTLHTFDFANLNNGNYHIILSTSELNTSLKLQILK